MPVLRPQPLLSLLLFLYLELGLSSLNFCLLSSAPLLLELFVFLGFPLLFDEGCYLFVLLLIPSLHFLLLELQKSNAVLHLGQFLLGLFLCLLLLEHLNSFGEHDVFVVYRGWPGMLGGHLG